MKQSVNLRQHPTEIYRRDQQRLDTWLWVSRFYRSRKLASESVNAGHVRVNGHRSKPGKTVAVGDILTINKSQQIYEISILELSDNRLSASLAAQLYLESETSKSDRVKNDLLRKNSRQGIRYDRKKPDKRERRKSVSMKQQSNS